MPLFQQMVDVRNFFKEREKLGIQLGTNRTKKLLQLLGNPQDQLKAVHVAGTNGKGSTIHFASLALLENHYNVGVFTSPSLEDIDGHYYLNNKKISERDFLHLFQSVYPAIQKLDEEALHPTSFEILTAMAFVYFSKHTDIAFIEAGMGGRDDTTNCFEPILSVITNIDNDHTNFLGRTIIDIAKHKAGIIKERIPIIIGEMDQEAMAVVQREALAKKSPIYRLGIDFHYGNVKDIQIKGQVFDWKYKDVQTTIQLPMYGKHQVKNSSLSFMALTYLENVGFLIDWKKVLKGFLKAHLPGRFEVIHTNTFQIILDGSHNEAGIKAFIQTSKNFLTDHGENHLIFSAFKDKEVEKMLKQLLPYFSPIYLTTFDHPRALSIEEITYYEKKYGKQIVYCQLEDILERINNESKEQDNRYFFTGSLHFIAKVRSAFKSFIISS